EVFVMRHLENLPIPKIAERVSRSSDAVRSSLYRAKKMVMESIDPGLAAAS
ncbi:MAG: sigma-70 region 4 domain-containing protein, partial [Myxococcales bacterium]|nr:sigma-70 region 4 domain-containing protein [Myxococcales bacterium]